MLINKVLDVQLARDIVRKSGVTLEEFDDLDGLIPPGGEPGDQLWFRSPQTLSDPVWFKPNYLSAIEGGAEAELAIPWLGDDKAVPIFTFSARNPIYTDIGGDDRDGTVEAAKVGDYVEELLVWEDIPAGFWYYPFNVDWFVTKRELTMPPGQGG